MPHKYKIPRIMPRHPTHDYRSICIYHITLSKRPEAPYFSAISGTPSAPEVNYYPLGDVILNQILSFSNMNPDLHIYQYIIMPDHIHFILHAMAYLDDPIGIYIKKMKIKTLQMARERGIYSKSVFKEDFYDRFLRPYHSLNTIYEYIRQNPYRLLMRRFYPDYFRRIDNIFFYKNMYWQAYGNLQLLWNPFKEAVVCHRADAGTPTEVKLLNSWRHICSNRGVLISPFIASKEKEVRGMAEGMNGRVILITNKAFGERYKPAKHDFEQCESGNLLIIAPMVSMTDGRETWVFLNKLAEDIAERKLGF